MTETTQRRARADELCTCGRRALVVYQTPDFGDVPYCGIPDGGMNKRCECGNMKPCADHGE